VPSGEHDLRFEFEVTGSPDIATGKGAPGIGQLYVDGELVGAGEIAVTMPFSLGLGAGLVCGQDAGSPVTERYDAPFPYAGTLHHVTVDVSGELIEDDENAMRIAMARQ